jgi:thioester reductase-like protein
MKHLVSGGTGFVGAAVILELLANTEDEIVALVRPGTTTGAQERIVDALQGAARAYGMNAEAVPVGRVRALAGDITLPGCGAEVANIFSTAYVWGRTEGLLPEEPIRSNVSGSVWRSLSQVIR